MMIPKLLVLHYYGNIYLMVSSNLLTKFWFLYVVLVFYGCYSVLYFFQTHWKIFKKSSLDVMLDTPHTRRMDLSTMPEMSNQCVNLV